ncbi:RICIN domain-containing protein [Streptomyces albipurpureus]|uniref:RICIN domain-containing protein n=1 Tax=Streptomyces albipurpureus TaxID=2897419 RepID=A0ABT0UIX7_9ACTN|nr:RICIN domain-containing protein [Streptomyces sp. CWNU-1]MCM2388612.1 RICIN domain-containing protein [Streptomyces sp. CWNU-1]
MQKPRTQSPVTPTRTGLDSAASDEGLAAALRANDGKDEARSVAVLIARHWDAVFDYASIGTPSEKAAAMLTTAAFSKALENLRQVRSSAAIRPMLLMHARRIAEGWATDERVAALPELRNPQTGQLIPADMFRVAENRILVARAFQALPGPAQCLLWHVDVEAEEISVPAGLLAMDERGGPAQLEQARKMLRAGILRFHLELAPEAECRHYNRLIDVSMRRGGALIPDIKAHLAHCEHCQFAAEQLDHGDGRLALLVAEGLLGWAAQPYLDSRPGRGEEGHQARDTVWRGPTSRAGRRLLGGRGGPPSGGRRRGRSERRRTAVVAGLGIVTGLVVVATVATEPWAGGGGMAGYAVPGGPISAEPLPGAKPPPGPQPSTTSAGGHPPGPLTTRLRNTTSGLCLDVGSQRALIGADVVLSLCGTSVTQRWIYEEDGRVRSSAAPELCVNSRAVDGVSVLSRCSGTTATDAAHVRYDLTVHGQMVPRWNEGLAVAPSAPRAGATVVVKVRDSSDDQRWATDRSTAVAPKIRPGNAHVGTVREAGAAPVPAHSTGSAGVPPAGHHGAPGAWLPAPATAATQDLAATVPAEALEIATTVVPDGQRLFRMVSGRELMYTAS